LRAKTRKAFKPNDFSVCGSAGRRRVLLRLEKPTDTTTDTTAKPYFLFLNSLVSFPMSFLKRLYSFFVLHV
jgi:hypothetical protein